MCRIKSRIAVIWHKRYYRVTITFEQVPIHAYHAYDALMTYARALTEVLEDGYDPRNGSAIIERIRNRSYHSVLGFDVRSSIR